MCCSVLQCVAVKCDVLQCAACATRYHEAVLKENSALQHVAVSSRIGVLQHVAVCCGVLLTHGYRAPGRHNRTLHANECNTLCNTLQHTATHCNANRLHANECNFGLRRAESSRAIRITWDYSTSFSDSHKVAICGYRRVIPIQSRHSNKVALFV